MKPTVYLAGPIAGLGFAGATEWRNAMAAILHPAGIKTLSPMRAKDYFAGVERDVGFSATCEEYGQFPLSTPRAIMTRDFFDATRCDLLLVNLLGAEKVSIGTTMEIAWAYQCRTPIVLVMEAAGNLHEHCMITEAIGFRTDSLDEAVDIVKAILL